MGLLLAYLFSGLFAYLVVRLEQQRERNSRPPEAQIPALRKNAGNAGRWALASIFFSPVMPIFFYLNRKSFVGLLIGLFWLTACAVAGILTAGFITSVTGWQ